MRPPFAPAERDSWTGGQYSLCRAAFGLCLAAWCAGAAARAAAGLPGGGLAAAAVAAAAGFLALAFAAGFRDRAAAAILLPVLAGLAWAGAPPAGAGAPLLGFILIVHLFTPAAPYGSLDARRRPDPGGSWSMPRGVPVALFAALAAFYAADAVLRWLRPGDRGTGFWVRTGVEAGFAPAALVARLRPWAWAAGAILQIARLAIGGDAGQAGALLLLHLFAFDPAWMPVRPRRTAGGGARPDLLFYDGTCGLCHAAVRFVLAEDPGGDAYRFAPLAGEHLRQVLSPQERAGLPDSLVVLTPARIVLTRSRAVRRMLSRLGGLWAACGALLALVPRPLADAAYDAVARVRYRLFARPADACPLTPPRLRERFILDGAAPADAASPEAAPPEGAAARPV